MKFLNKDNAARAVRAALLLAFIGAITPVGAFAQTVPSPWVAGDIGSPMAGSTTYASGIFTVKAAGRDIWGTADQFRFVYQSITGDADVIARVDSITQADEWSKAGVMIRASLTAGAAHGFALVSAANGSAFQRRTASGGASTNTDGPVVAAPRWVRLIRLGSKVTTFISADGQVWTRIGSDTVSLGSVAYVGLAATSHNASALSTVKLSNVTIVPLTTPTSQTAADIGAPGLPGTVSSSAGTYTVNAAGLDIWNTADQFHYVYQRITGDIDVSMRVRSVSAANAWSKTGVMIRETLSPGSRHAFALLSAGRGYAFHRRIDPNGFSDGGTGVAGAPPGWVRLVRTGNTFKAFRSVDGVNWTSLGTDVVPMASTVYVGIATTSHNAAATTKVVLDSFKVTGTVPPPGNTVPAVTLTGPANGATFAAPASVLLTATASDTGGSIARVEFYSGTTLLGTEWTAPYAFTWSSVPAGTYSLTAVAYDSTGLKGTSASRTIVVSGAVTTPPRAVVFRKSVDHATVTSYRLDVFASGANPATATPVGTSNLGKPTPDANGDITVDRLAFFTALATGNYQATVSAIGTGASSRSVPVTFTR